MDRKLLWGRAGNRCAWESCEQRLTVDLRNPESHVLREHGAVLGEEAHIRSSRLDGPRHDSSYPVDMLDSYENLILLCPTHHTVIDKDHGEAWSTDELITLKAKRERSVDREAGPINLQAQREDELLAARISLWEQKADLQEWQSFTAALNAPIPLLRTDKQEDLFALGSWLLAMRWPERYPRMKAAFENYQTNLAVLLEHFMREGEPLGSSFAISREYKRIPWNPELYDELMEKFNLNCEVAWWLAIELTRSVNLIISAVTSEFDPLYRFSEGLVLMSDGDGLFVRSVSRVTYERFDWAEVPYRRSREDVIAAISVAKSEDGEVDLWRLKVPSSRYT